MMRAPILVLILFSALTISGQRVGGKPAGDTEQLATVTTTPDRWALKSGQDLGVTLTIKAGDRGAYIPNQFTDWADTCQTGFVVDIYTLKGDRASTSSKSCAGSWLSPGPPAKELLKDYVFLKSGEIRSWHITLTQIRKSPGTYELKAEYYAHPERIEEVAALPEVHGLMVVGHITAKPVRIRIR
jgi:hypothetical protein